MTQDKDIDTASEINGNEAMELLMYAAQNGNIDIGRLKTDVEMKKREKLLSMHQSTIYQGKDGNWYTYLPDNATTSKRKKIKRKTKEQVEDVVADYYREVTTVPTLAKAFEEWQDYTLSMNQVQKSTYDRRKNDFDRFIKNRKIANIPIDEITDWMVLTFLDEFIKEYSGKIGRKAFNNMKSLITGTFGYFMTYKRVEVIKVKDIFECYKVPGNVFKKPKTDNQVFMDDEADKLIKLIRKEYWMDMRALGILFMLFTGLRVGELATLKMSDFISENRLHVQRTLTKEKDVKNITRREVSDTPKTESSDAVILLSEDAIMILNQVKKVRLLTGNASCEWTFTEDGDLISDNKFDKQLRKFCRDLKIPERGCHKLRKTYCSELLGCGVDQKIVQNQMRHADIRTTEKYYHFNTKCEDVVREEINKNNKLSAVNY